MPKQNDRSPAEDYLAQLEWKARRGTRRSKAGWPWWASDEPNWKYLPAYSIGSEAPPIFRFMVIGAFLATVGYLLFQAIFMRSGMAIFMGIVILFIGLILILAAQDFTKTKKPR